MRSTLATLAKAFWGICTFRLAPQDIPHSTALLAVVSVANFTLSTSIYYQIRMCFGPSLLSALVEMIVLFSLTAALLYSFARAKRAVQTLAALMGTGTLVGSITLSLLILFPALKVPAALGTLMLWGILLWNLSIVAHVMRNALDTRFVVGFFIAIGYAIFLHGVRTFVNQMFFVGVV